MPGPTAPTSNTEQSNTEHPTAGARPDTNDEAPDDTAVEDTVEDTATDADRPGPGMDPLFGPGLRIADGYAQHDWAQLRTRFGVIAREVPRLVALSVRLAWRADRPALVAVGVAEAGIGAGTAAGLLATNRALSHVLAQGALADRLTAAIPALLVLVAIGVATGLLRAVVHTARARLGPRVDRLAYTTLLERAATVELSTLEDSGFHNLLGSARRGAMSARQVTDAAIGVVTAAVGLFAASGALAALHPALVGLLVLVVVPKGWGSVRCARARFTSVKNWMEVSRQLDLIAGLIIDRGAAEEVRAHHAAPFLLGHYRRLAGLSETEAARLGRVEARTQLVTGALSGLALVATYAALAGLVYLGAIPLPAAGTAVVAIGMGGARLTEMITQVDQLYEHGLFVLDWQDACVECERAALRTGPGVPAARPARITTHALSFTYPATSRRVVSDVDLTIHSGEVVALVGSNGSGKTTLARLLTGLYLPDEGDVRWDGVSVRELDRTSVFDRVALIGQEFMRWPFTARVNVTIGRGDRPPGRLHAAARAGDTLGVVADLPHGWDSLLAREFWGGVSLSGGQWQRLGLARVWYRDAPVLVFDEPTAALDPRTELEVFDRVVDLAGAGHAVVLITHRLASVRRADRIYVLAGGRVIEQGTHGELMAADGEYAATFRLQAAQYET